jgi:hypothetical protein
VRGTHICNLFRQIRPRASTKRKKKKIASPSAEKNPKNLEILKLQYLDFPDFVSDDLFFQLGFFSERKSDIEPIFANFSHKYTKNFWNVTVLFFLLRKKICKNKKYLPTMSAKESALIPLVKC